MTDEVTGNKEFGNRLRRLRENAGLKQEDVAKKAGTTAQSVSNWENGLRAPRIDSFHRICQLFDTSYEVLWLGERRVAGNAPRDHLLGDYDALDRNMKRLAEEILGLLRTHRERPRAQNLVDPPLDSSPSTPVSDDPSIISFSGVEDGPGTPASGEMSNAAAKASTRHVTLDYKMARDVLRLIECVRDGPEDRGNFLNILMLRVARQLPDDELPSHLLEPYED